jgi:membrane-bound lytic murein transglycosylase B
MIPRYVLLGMLLAMPVISHAVTVKDYPYLAAMIDRLVVEHGLNKDELIATFEKVRLRPQVVEAITRPAERLPWHRYRSFFITPKQIKNGVRFWNANRDVLSRAEAEIGVPAEVVVAIIGIETRYGTTLGSHLVLESLTTLTLQYPRRQKFFGGELEHFLLLTHEHSLDRFTIKGSYAGAIGIPQFMPSSYREYALDYSGDGKADLVNQTEDAIGSVANYLKRSKWREGGPLSVEITSGAIPDSIAGNRKRPNTTVGELRALGVKLDAGVADDMNAGVVSLDGKDGTLNWVVFDNFYVVMRYNPSVLYAMAVNELSSMLKKEFLGSWRNVE